MKALDLEFLSRIRTSQRVDIKPFVQLLLEHGRVALLGGREDPFCERQGLLEGLVGGSRLFEEFLGELVGGDN